MSKKRKQTYTICKICCKKLTCVGLARHLNFIHGIKSTKEYFDTYIEQFEHVCIHCHKNPTKFLDLNRGYKESCGSHDCEIAQIKKSKLEKHGDPNYNNREKFKVTMSNRTDEEKQLSKDKQHNTIEKHKTENPNYQKEINKKSLQTRLNKYGKFESAETIQKRKDTTKERYGVECVFQLSSIKEDIKHKNLQNLNVEYPSQSLICQEKTRQTRKKHLEEDPNFLKNIEMKQKSTNLKNNGSENYRNIEQQKQTVAKQTSEEKRHIIKKRQQTNLKKIQC